VGCLIAVVRTKCHYRRMGRSFLALALIGALVVPTTVSAENWRSLPRRIAKRCGTPPEWVSVTSEDEVHLQPPPDADYTKVDCILMQLRQKKGIKLGFIGNEADPNQALDPGWSYIASGSIGALTTLAIEARKAGWITDPIAKADDGTGFLTFRTSEGTTEAQATAFADRLWKHQLGDIKFGPAPTRNGSGFNGD